MKTGQQAFPRQRLRQIELRGLSSIDGNILYLFAVSWGYEMIMCLEELYLK
jgi:hypothetical protein